MTAASGPPAIPAERYATRLRRAATRRRPARRALIGVGPDLRYLTGYQAMPLERLTMLAVVAGRPPLLIVPRLEGRPRRAGLRTTVEMATWMRPTIRMGSSPRRSAAGC